MKNVDLDSPGTGLFETHVTWEDVEEDMKNQLGTTASFGPNKTVIDMGDGKGFMSKLLLIRPDWQDNDGELPEKFILKACQALVIPISIDQQSSFLNKRYSDN
ncbi:hypothetical protein COOONC_18172 [Cooperia oncophora]